MSSSKLSKYCRSKCLAMRLSRYNSLAARSLRIFSPYFSWSMYLMIKSLGMLPMMSRGAGAGAGLGCTGAVSSSSCLTGGGTSSGAGRASSSAACGRSSSSAGGAVSSACGASSAGSSAAGGSSGAEAPTMGTSLDTCGCSDGLGVASGCCEGFGVASGCVGPEGLRAGGPGTLSVSSTVTAVGTDEPQPMDRQTDYLNAAEVVQWRGATRPSRTIALR